MVFGAASVDAVSLNMGLVIGQRFPLAVPRYQRSYAWQDEAVGDFVQDVETMLLRPAGHTSHFFGGVVCIQVTDNQRAHPTSYEVVDGQQRLATLMLGLSCVVEAASILEERCRKTNIAVAASALTLRDDTVDNFLTWKDADVAAGTTTTRRRMNLSLADDEVFGALLLAEACPASTRESHDLLIAARAALMKMTDCYVGTTGAYDKRLERLVRLRQALLQDAHVIHIVSEERSQAYRLFSVLNHRGESLSDADLLRSRSLELLEQFDAQQEEAAKIWDEMLGEPAAQVEAFFRALYPSVTGQRAKGDLFEATEAHFFPSAAPTTLAKARALVSVVQGFRDEFNVFLRLSRGAWPFDRQPGKKSEVKAWQRDRLRRLILTLKHELALPTLLAGAQVLDEKTFAAMVYAVEIFAFRYKIICNGHATRPANIYYAQAKLMRESNKSKPYAFTPFRKALAELIAKHAGDTIFAQLLVENLRYSNASQRPNIREFLTTLEDHRTWWIRTGSKNTGAKPKPKMTKVIDIEDATLEHIYPNSAAALDVDPALESTKHTLGNMTFFGESDNVAAANKPFKSKRDTYYKPSEIAMTSDLAAYVAWTPSDVASREQGLVDQGLRVFAL